MEIKSQEELLKRIRPALRTKHNELVISGIKIVTENDIWNFNIRRWKNSTGLTIADLVDDILNTPNKEYEDYALKRINDKDE